MLSKKRIEWGARLGNLAASPNKNAKFRNSDVSQRKNKVAFVIESVEGDSRPHLDVRVFGREMRALLDSGASRTILGKEGNWVFNGFPARLRSPSVQFVETADSKKHSIQGTVNLPITLEGQTKYLEVLYVPTLRHNLLLGIDFWEKFHIVADLHHRRWEFSKATNTSFCSSLSGGIQGEEHLTADQKNQLDELVNKHFSGPQPSLGRTDKVFHTIDTDNAPAVKQRYYPMSPARQKMVSDELDKMLQLGVVEPSKSDWSSPILLVDKPDGSKRVCVNFKKLNSVSKKDAYPLPQVTTILDRLRDARYLSSLDIKSAFWQIPLDPSCREKTAFTVPGRGLFHFVTMPMGLSNAPATWQRFVDNVLGADLEPYCFVYLDDVIAVTPTFEKHIEVLSEILRRIKEAKVTLNRDKCQFCRPELKYLGYVVSEKGLRVDPEKVKAIIDLPVPQNQKEVRQFCGTASWYRRFIPNFAARLFPLTTLLKKRAKFVWSKEAQDAFLDIRSCLVTSPILSCPDFSKSFVISCDASGVGVGAVLSQESNQGEVVVAYASRTLSKQEQKYSATERECLAVIWAVERFRPYVEGTKFKVITDHYSLLWLYNLRDPQGRLARWALRLQPYDFELVHRKGKENIVPDLLSRSAAIEPDENFHCDVVIPVDVKDKWYARMLKNVRSEGQKYPQWRVKDHQLLKRINDQIGLSEEEDDKVWKLVLPKESRVSALEECHDQPTAGHLGTFKTYKRLQLKYYWPKMRKDTASYISRCKICQRTKYNQNVPAGLMGERRGVDEPWKMVAADLMGPFPRSTKGFKYILVITDTFTKFSILKPLRAATARAVAQHLEEDIFLVYGVPKYLVFDNGSEFTGAPVKNLAAGYKCKILYNPSRHPQSNPTERVNRNVITMIRAYVGARHREWDKHLAQIGFALRTAVHEVTGFSPAFLNFGREPSASGVGVDLQSDDVGTVEDCGPYGRKLQELQDIFKEVKDRLVQAHEKSSHRYNLRRRPQEFKDNDLVLKRNFSQSDAAAGFSAKLTDRFVGPFRITKKISNVVYSLEDLQGKDAGKWHVNDLKRYIN